MVRVCCIHEISSPGKVGYQINCIMAILQSENAIATVIYLRILTKGAQDECSLGGYLPYHTKLHCTVEEERERAQEK
jgi:hypothetical protein